MLSIAGELLLTKPLHACWNVQRCVNLPVANDKSDDDASFLLQSLEILAHGNPRASQIISAQPGSHTLQQVMQSLTLCNQTYKGVLIQTRHVSCCGRTPCSARMYDSVARQQASSSSGLRQSANSVGAAVNDHEWTHCLRQTAPAKVTPGSSYALRLNTLTDHRLQQLRKELELAVPSCHFSHSECMACAMSGEASKMLLSSND